MLVALADLEIPSHSARPSSRSRCDLLAVFLSPTNSHIRALAAGHVGEQMNVGTRPSPTRGTPRSPHRHERGVSDRLGQTNQVDATACRWLSIMRGGHSCVTQFRNQEDTGGLERTRGARRLSTRGHARNRRDTEGHTVVPVRDREAPGSNPGRPPTIFRVQNRRFLRLSEWTDHSRVTDS